MLRHSSKKRAVESETDSCDALEERMKKVKITNSPGQIRLKRDLAEIGQVEGILFLPGVDCASIIIQFCDSASSSSLSATAASGMRSNLNPYRFSVSVPRYYPHACPIVKCLDMCQRSRFVDADGTIIHDILKKDGTWSAIMSLRDVINVLVFIRSIYQTGGNIPETPFPSGVPIRTPSGAVLVGGDCDGGMEGVHQHDGAQAAAAAAEGQGEWITLRGASAPSGIETSPAGDDDDGSMEGLQFSPG